MPEVFHNSLGDDQHDKFQDWREANPRGFVINCKTSKKGMLHRSYCQHMGDFKWEAEDGFGLTKSRKLCGPDRDELTRWAAGWNLAIEICNDCMRD